MQDALPQIAPVPLKKGTGSGACRLPFFDHAFIPGYVRISFLDIGLTEYKADIGYLFDILGRKILFPAKGDVASLDDHVLAVLDACLDHLPDDGPQIACELGIITFGRQRAPAAPDEPHLQMIQRQAGIAVCLHQLLRQQGLSRMSFPGDQNDHRSPPPGPPCGEKPLRLPRMGPCVRPFAPYATRMRSAARRALSPRWRHP